MDKLRIIYWNASGLRRKMQFLRFLLQEHSVDIALISESHLLPAHSATIPGYNIIRLDSSADNAFRGLLVAVRRSVIHHQLPALDTQSLQALGVEAHTGASAHSRFTAREPSA